MKKKTEKLWFCLHDGYLDGDSSYHCPPEYKLPYKEGMTLNDMIEAVKKEGIKVGEYHTEEQIRQCLKECKIDKEPDMESDGGMFNYIVHGGVKGAWILDKKGLDACEEIWEDDPHNDSAVYACNRAAKRIANKLCVKHIGKRPKGYSYED